MTEKICSVCGELKPYTEFHKHPQCVGGVHSKCKVCRRAQVKAAYDVRRKDEWFKVLQERAAKRGIPVTVTAEELLAEYEAQGGTCALSGVPITIGDDASVDRIVSSIGYAPGNVQWTHKHLNIMKNNHLQADFVALCRSVARHHDRTDIQPAG